MGIDWDVLRDKATAAAARAYAPYSHFPVGAAALVDDGRIVIGCNVENASYGITACAELNMAGQLAISGGGRLVAFACRDDAGQVLAPCGSCRQVLHEFGGPELLVDTTRGVVPLAQLLPDAFGPQDLKLRQR